MMRETITKRTAKTNFRSSRRRVALREPTPPPSSASSLITGISSLSFWSIRALISCQIMSPMIRTSKTLSTSRAINLPRGMSKPHSLSTAKKKDTTSITRKHFLIKGT